MSIPRLTALIVPLALGLPLLVGACAAPLAVTAASYGTDGVSMAETGKTGTDHFVSMVSKQDCALWRVFRNQSICHPFEGDQNPYNVDYNAPFRQGGEGGVEYSPPPHAAAGAPAASWDPSVYNTAPAPSASSPSATAAVPAAPAPPRAAAAMTADAAPIPAAAPPAAAPAKVKKKHAIAGRSAVRHKPPKKPARDPAATVP